MGKQTEIKASILDMAMGAIKERVDYEMAAIMDNIMDPNTEAASKRKLTLMLELKPDADRRTINVSCSAKSTLVPTNPVYTSLYVGAEQDRRDAGHGDGAPGAGPAEPGRGRAGHAKSA